MTLFKLTVLFVLTCITTCVQAKYLTGKGFFCRDPDTGKLHTVNSTWPSTTFCGNYTCKLKKKNVTETEYAPIREININNVNVGKGTDPIDADDTNFAAIENSKKMEDMSESPSIVIEKRVKPDIQPLFHKEQPVNPIKIPKTQIELEANNVDNGDRYLTESEIKTISELLHTVKKSDLDAIVDIYNLAQEIYQEMDKTTEKIVDEKLKSIKENTVLIDNKHTSYWYEPLHLGHKYKPKDLEKQGSNIIPTTSQPLEEPQYFHRPTGTDLNKIPNNYPLSDFQRMASYINPKPIMDVHKKPCKPKDSPRIGIEPPKMIQSSILLPYPFTYIPHYNYTYPGNLFPNGYPLSWNVYNRKAYQPFINAYIARIPPNTVLINPHSHIGKDVELAPLVKEDTNILEKVKKAVSIPDWQTDPLPPYVLEEIKANIDKKLKSSPLKKMINLEKVGKVIKLDEFSRSKRNVGDSVNEDLGSDNEGSEYDVVLEKTICHSETDTRPGYFRVGDLNQPYPGCCPQRIDRSD
ncbi:hypothetical protein K1T71_012747 [Dendrolimus kikuchii]|uniref:Uncharacterized protein n=1 Tax=Dendrolimus kikuchii TaxID=765133 RepID=A0ACC1CKN4_9NEOP|nr:hypothetical protein K1T71_012747 [Dendrolimus kikuchii]